MKFDLKTSTILVSLFFMSTLSKAEQGVLTQLKDDLPAVKDIRDRELLETFLMDNAPNLSASTIESITGMISNSQNEQQLILQDLSKNTGDIRFMGSQPECTDVSR